MNKIAIIYESKYGSSEKYARWIVEEKKGDLYKSSEIRPKQLMLYDTIIYGGGLYASGISGVSILSKNYEMIKDRKLIVFTVGLASTDNKEIFTKTIEKNFSEEMIANIKFFHLRGGIDYEKLGLVHKIMMAMLKRVTSRKDEKDLSDEDIEFLSTYGKKVDFIDKDTLDPLLSYIDSY